MAVLVDSSVWISAQHKNNKEFFALSNLLKSEEIICTTKLIQVEVTQGAKTEEQFRKLWDGFNGLEFLQIKDQHWLESAVNFFRCRKKGLTLTTIDCLLATVAKSYSVHFWTLDKQFKEMQKTIGFQMYRGDGHPVTN